MVGCSTKSCTSSTFSTTNNIIFFHVWSWNRFPAASLSRTATRWSFPTLRRSVLSSLTITGWTRPTTTGPFGRSWTFLDWAISNTRPITTAVWSILIVGWSAVYLFILLLLLLLLLTNLLVLRWRGWRNRVALGSRITLLIWRGSQEEVVQCAARCVRPL